MDLYTILSNKLDIRRNSNECSFNGYLEDYLEIVDESKKPIFNSIFEKYPDMRIMVDSKYKASEESITNLIIRYKDINKLGNKAIIVPYVLYNKEKTILLADEYIYAKALYYSLSENGSRYKENKNEIVAICFEDDIISVLDKFDKNKTGQLQRELDIKHFKTYEDGYNKAQELAKEIQDTYIKKVRETKQKEKYIYSCVSRWYLLKKFVYVSYMVNKQVLKELHNNDTKSQRTKAKEYTDSIRYVAMSKMWDEVKNKKNTQG